MPQAVAGALKAIDVSLLSKLIDQCINDEQFLHLRTLQLENCGPYVMSRARGFEQALAEHKKAKSSKKRAETAYSVRKAGSDLSFAVQQMIDRVATEEREGQLFHVDDNVMPPLSFSKKLSVSIRYQWRASVVDQWNLGCIVFSHEVVSSPYSLLLAPGRKSSAAKQERDRQDDLYRDWEYLKSLGLQAVRDHFRRGGSGAAIPQRVQAKIDSHTKGLNNFSADF